MEEVKNILNQIKDQNDLVIQAIDHINLKLTEKDSPWLTADEAAEYAGFNTNYFRQLINREIPFFQRGRKIMIHKADLEAWMQKNKVEPI